MPTLDSFTTELFKTKAKLKHGNTYNYDLSVYVGAPVKLQIKCSIHGIFNQRASAHLRGAGCHKCGLISMASKITTWTQMDKDFLLKNYSDKGAKFCAHHLCKPLHSTYHVARCLGLRKNRCKLVHDTVPGRIWSNILNNAKIRQLPVNITPDDIYNLYITQNKKCALSGKSIYLGKELNKLTASVDRINSNKGYIKGNIQLVYKIINRLKLDMTDEEYFKLSKSVYFNLKSRFEPTTKDLK